MTREEAKSELMQLYGSLSEEKKQALDVLMAQADGEYKSNKELLCDSCYRKIAGCQAKFHNPHPVDHCIEYKPIEKQADGEYISRQDAISRDAVLDALEVSYLKSEIDDDTYQRIRDMPRVAIPTAEPQTGHWIIKDGKEQGYDIAGKKTWYTQIMCDKCGFIKISIEGHTGKYHYCPHCGVKMVEPQEGSE